MTEDSERLAALERRIVRLEEALRARNSREQKLAAEEMLAGETSPATAESAIPRNRMVLPTPRSGSPIPSAMPTFADAPIARTPARDWEALIGQYGTLILATITALAAVGTFIGWAIANGWLGPAQRIGLGLVTAAAIGAWGLRLRQRERSFGASLIGIALAIVHVCAWGAGPSLHLVPTATAFALAAAASLALETFAHLEDDEALWGVGFFGAALAPFVTSDGGGSLPLLTIYGVGVLVSGGYVLGDRPWRIAGRLFVLSAALYTGALMLGWEADNGPVLAMLFPLAVGFLGVLRWTGGWRRRMRLRGLGVLAGVAGLRVGVAIGLPLSRMTLAESIGAAGVAWLALVALTHRVSQSETDETPSLMRAAEGDRLDAAWLPLLFAFSVLAALGSSGWPQEYGVALALCSGVLLATHSWYPAGGLRDGAAFATVVCAVFSAAFLANAQPAVALAAIAVIGASGFAADLWRPSAWWTGSGMVALAWSMTGALGLLDERIAYDYTPFWTSASASCAVILGSVAAAWRLARESERKALAAGAAVAWAFVWVHQEIAGAVSATVATLLRVSYYAATSVAAVGVGRARKVPILRHAGLGLAIIAAGTALYSASSLRSVGARIFADLVAAGFLLAIAFWYRKPGESAATEPAFPPSRSDT